MTRSKPGPRTRVTTTLALIPLLSSLGLSQMAAAEEVSPMLPVAPQLPPTEIGLNYLEIKADPYPEPPMVEVVPDNFSMTYRNGREVYKEMAEHSFDDEPMVEIAPAADPALALPEVVVVASHSEPVYTHVTVGERVVDAIPTGEDKIFLQISAVEVSPEAARRDALRRFQSRRFFSKPGVRAIEQP
ncbi:hypothetical protein [Motiliproteus sp.]|uniref:hypothetical protein n=1 Tax=Motiliproteus sp. TaxID=1898955 RepID=UPI003BA8AF79